ncbi:MAG: hypothetical protein IJ512_00045 [Ruminococcus sp.]|nr:hypothetical protein [Ruminococcus sp.]
MDKNKVDIIEKRKKRRFHRSMLRLLVLLLIAAFCVFLYMERGNWISGMGNRIESIRQNDGVLAEGNFPLTISGNGEYQAQILDNRLAILNNSYLYLYSVQGDSVDTRQVAYTKSVLKTAGEYALCFENGGSGFRVDKAGDAVYEKEAENVIITGTISSTGYVALVTESSTYSCSLYVYDTSGKKVYTRNCVERINDVCFRADNSGCVIVQLDAEDGEITSWLRSITFEEKETSWETPTVSTLCLETSFTNDGRICVIGDSMCAYYNEKGQMESMYTYSGSLVSYHVENGQAAVLVRSDETRETNLILFEGSAESPVEIAVNNASSYVRIDNSAAYLMSTDNIVSYSFSGKAIATVGLDRAYERFLKQDDYLFLLSYDQIDRVNFNQ